MLHTCEYCQYGTNHSKALHLYFLGILAALELLMSFSLLGYFHIEPISITFAFIPVLIAGCMLGPKDAALIGLLFGLASMYKASAFYVYSGDKIFSILSGTPIASFILSVGSRFLFGIVVGQAYVLAHKAQHLKLLCLILVTFFGKDLHAMSVYTIMWMTHPERGYTTLSAFNNYFTIVDIATRVVATTITIGCYIFSRSESWKNICCSITAARELHLRHTSHRISHFILILSTLVFAGALAEYFVQRISFVLRAVNIDMPHQVKSDIIILEIQFLLGLLALTLLLSLILRIGYMYNSFKRHNLTLDELTKIFNRKKFFPSCDEALKNMNFVRTNLADMKFKDLTAQEQTPTATKSQDIHSRPTRVQETSQQTAQTNAPAVANANSEEKAQLKNHVPANSNAAAVAAVANTKNSSEENEQLKAHAPANLKETSLQTTSVQEKGLEVKPAGYFLMMDVDHFKTINDTYGHMEGDRILQEISNVLRSLFSDKGIIGRLGGDEFAMLIYKPLPQSEIKQLLNQLMNEIHRIPCGTTLVTTSIGVYPITTPMTSAELYEKTDALLYRAKENGRNQFAIASLS